MIPDVRTVQIMEGVQDNICIFYQVVPIDNLRHITGPVDKFSSES